MKILVTGGAGFIGSHLCERLQKGGHEVYSLDNYFTGSKENHVPGVEYISGSTDKIEWNLSVYKFKPEVIYHLGEYSRVEQSFLDIEFVLEYNKNGTQAVLEYVRKNNCRLIYAGSSTKFGDNGNNSNASPYAWSKSSNTLLVKNYGDWYGIDYAITYFYNVYGEREIKSGPYATLIALFSEKMYRGEYLTVVSPGTQERNFTHIDDIIDGLILIGFNGQGDEYGIGNPKAYTILEVAEMFAMPVEMLPERKGNRMKADVITEKTRKLGWEPKRNLEDYINNLKMEYYDL